MITLLEVFDNHFNHVKFDAKLAKSIYSYHVNYMNSNREYLEFFGSNLLGVHVIRFKDSDVSKLFDILDIDYFELTTAIKKVKAIDQDRKVSSDTLNITCMYLMHRFMSSPLLSETARYRACYDVAVIFYMRCLAAILSAWVRYPADPKTAQAAYANLSYKFLIKRLGSWHKVIDYRAKDLSSKSGIHHKTLLELKDDYAVVYAINDSAGRIQDIVKGYYRELVKVNDTGSKIGTTSSTMIDVEGEEVTKEKVGSVETYISYLSSIITDEHSFIKEELISVILKINVNSSTRMVRSVLRWMSHEYNNTKYNKLIDEFISKLIIHTFHVLNDNTKVPNLRDYPTLLVNLKNFYLSTRSTDSDLVRIRELGSNIITSSQDTNISDALILSSRTAIMLYIILRMLIGKQNKIK